MKLICEQQGDILVVRVKEQRIDAAVAIRFKDQMREVLLASASRVILDLSLVDFMDSSGLGAVVAVMKLSGPHRTLELAGLTPIVEKVFRLTRMDQVFVIHAKGPMPERRYRAG